MFTVYSYGSMCGFNKKWRSSRKRIAMEQSSINLALKTECYSRALNSSTPGLSRLQPYGRHRRRTGDLFVGGAVGLIVHLLQDAPRPDPRIGYGGKRAAESRYRWYRRLLLQKFVVSVRENSGGELVGCWLPFNTLFEIDDMNLSTTSAK